MDKRYNHTQSEQDAQKKWQEEKTYDTHNNPGTLYSIDTPPPTVSGSLHIGHIFSYTQTDILARYKRMNGFSVFYPFGFDDNGLPTERYVEKKRKIKGHQLPRPEFIQICLEESKKAEHEFAELWQRIGISANWDHTYSTISDSSRKMSQASFIELYKKGFIYRKDEPALYCINCRTSVAQAELDDKECPSFFNDIVFKDQKGNDLIIGTTRPELLPSCVALLYNPNDERYTHLEGQQATVPLFGFNVPIIADELVDIEKGTGLVMCCTFGDKTDIEWFKKHNLPYKQSIGFDGKFVKGTGILEGLKTKVAREKVIEELIKQNLLLRQKEITHAVSVHERCKKEIEFVVLKQWFVNILDHKQKFLEQGEKINWYPSFMKARYKNWVENLGWDWCISRQRFYGIPFPVWHCTDCNKVLLADIKDLPIDPTQTPYPDKCDCGSTNIEPDTDVMDTWNTSSISPYLCYGIFTDNKELPFEDDKITKEFLPMSMRPQAHDIIRTWAFYTIVKTWMHHNVIPWQDIVISGHVLADSKEKISKSKGGAKLTPERLLTDYAADAIRYWTASGSLGHDVAFSEEQLKIGNRLITKLWNAFRFAFSHLEGFDASKAPDNFGTVNEWLLDRATKTFESYQNYLEKNEFGLALNQIEQFFWNDFCDNYLELIKNQLFNPDQYNADHVHATKWTLYHVGLRILQFYAPYLPHVTETIYGLLYAHKKSIHQTRFTDIQIPYVFTQSADLMNNIISVVTQVRKLKSENQLSLKTELARLTIHADNEKTLEHIKTQEQLIRGVTQAQEIKYSVAQDKITELKQKDDVWRANVNV